MKRLVSLVVALVLLGGCGAQVAQEEITISSEQARDIIIEIIDPGESMYVETEGTSVKEDGRTYYTVHAYHVKMLGPEDGMTLTYGWYLVDQNTGEPFENSIAGAGPILPLKQLHFIHASAEEWEDARAAAETLFPEQDCNLYQFVRRDGRDYSVYILFSGPFPRKIDLGFCDLVTNELFRWNLDTDTLTPYSPA